MISSVLASSPKERDECQFKCTCLKRMVGSSKTSHVFQHHMKILSFLIRRRKTPGGPPSRNWEVHLCCFQPRHKGLNQNPNLPGKFQPSHDRVSWVDELLDLGPLVVWIPGIPENDSGIGILGCTPIRIPNHRAPNQQLTVRWRQGFEKKRASLVPCLTCPNMVWIGQAPENKLWNLRIW